MYKEEIRRFRTSIEKRYTYKGLYGAKGEKRAEKEKPTSEQLTYQNKKNKSRRIRWLIKGNFSEDDLFVTLTYARGTRQPMEDTKRDIRKLLRKLRTEYGKLGVPLKYIYVIEIGSRGGIHAHVIINECGHTAKLISRLWSRGHPHYENLYEDGGYEQLADYMAKVPEKKEDTTIREQCIGNPEYAYSRSRNLVMVEPETKIYFRRTMKKRQEQIEGGAKTHQDAPWITEGYVIDRDSIKSGINPFTGLSYLEYTEIPIKRRE